MFTILLFLVFQFYDASEEAVQTSIISHLYPIGSWTITTHQDPNPSALMCFEPERYVADSTEDGGRQARSFSLYAHTYEITLLLRMYFPSESIKRAGIDRNSFPFILLTVFRQSDRRCPPSLHNDGLDPHFTKSRIAACYHRPSMALYLLNTKQKVPLVCSGPGESVMVEGYVRVDLLGFVLE